MRRTPSDLLLEDPVGHRRRTARQVRHQAKAQLHLAVLDTDVLEDADVTCPQGHHDLGRKESPRPGTAPKPGRRRGFKVWKTPFWKRRHAARAARNRVERRLALSE